MKLSDYQVLVLNKLKTGGRDESSLLVNIKICQGLLKNWKNIFEDFAELNARTAFCWLLRKFEPFDSERMQHTANALTNRTQCSRTDS